MLLTTLRVRPGAFSPGLLVVLFVTLLSGATFGLSDSFLVDILGGTSALMMAVWMAATMVFAAAVAFVGVLALETGWRGASSSRESS